MILNLDAMITNLRYQQDAIHIILMDAYSDTKKKEQKDKLLDAVELLVKFNNDTATKYGGGKILVDFTNQHNIKLKAIG